MAEGMFWSTTLNKYLGDYINNYTNTWSVSNEHKRFRDLNRILNFIIKRIKDKKPYDTPYELIPTYINNSADSHFMTWGYVCNRDSKISAHSDDIKNMKKFDDLCEHTVYIKNIFSEINSHNCKEIKNYIEQKISELRQIYTTSDSKYSNILRYYGFTSFSEINTTVEKLKSKCQENIAGTSLAGHQGEMPQYSGKNSSIIAVTSL
ncbi:PIR protein [Plasmodium ovale]|uniref:PIR protein n=1 Tax=Plasmodium ovale TaxID=36330 RepID=A0A1D3JEP1_PLAOA|nr:PIR protein [Plasmodium ovale]